MNKSLTMFCYLKVLRGGKRIQNENQQKEKASTNQISLFGGFGFLVRLKDIDFIWTNINFNLLVEFSITTR